MFLRFWPRELHKSIKAAHEFKWDAFATVLTHSQPHCVQLYSVFAFLCVMVCTSSHPHCAPVTVICRGCNHISAGLLKYSPTLFSASNCKCEELSLKQIGWILTSLSAIN